MDSVVFRIQQWQEQKKKEKQERRRAHYEKNRGKIIQKEQEAQKTSQEAKRGLGRSLRSKNTPIKEGTRKSRARQSLK